MEQFWDFLVMSWGNELSSCRSLPLSGLTHPGLMPSPCGCILSPRIPLPNTSSPSASEVMSKHLQSAVTWLLSISVLSQICILMSVNENHCDRADTKFKHLKLQGCPDRSQSWPPHTHPAPPTVLYLFSCQVFLSIIEVGFSLSVFFFVVLRFEPRTPHMPHKCSITELLPQSWRVNFQNLSDGWPLKDIVIIWKKKWGRLKSELNGENDSGSWKGDGLLSSVPTKCRVLQGEGFPPPWVRRETDSACTLCKVSHQALGGSTKMIHDYWLQARI